jgi:hypothetical protein
MRPYRVVVRNQVFPLSTTAEKTWFLGARGRIPSHRINPPFLDPIVIVVQPPNALRLSRAAIFPKCASIQNAPHNPIFAQIPGRGAASAATLCWAVLTWLTFSVRLRYPLRDGSWSDRQDQRAIPAGAPFH